MSRWRPFDIGAVPIAAERRRQLLHLQLLALVPVIFAGLLNTGYQFLEILSGNPEMAIEDLRGRLALALVTSRDDPAVYDLLLAGAAHLLPVLLMALLCGGFWERVIAARMGRQIETGFVPIALLFTLLLPGAAPFAHVVFGMSFAILIGKAIFGGDGKTFLSPALLGIAIVQVSYPGVAGEHPLWQGLSGYGGSDAFALFARGGEAALADADISLWRAFLGATPGPMGTTSELAVIVGAALLLYARMISWRLLAAQIIGLAVVATLFNLAGAGAGASTMSPQWHLVLGAFLFGAVYLACDPVASCCTNPGRWIQGLLIGALIVLIRVANPTHPDAVVPALLLASITAPLIDHAVIAYNVRQRSRRRV